NPFRSFTAYQSVTAGTRRLRVFMTPSITDTLVGAPVMWDTTITFVAGANYTIVMAGFARAGGGVPLQMVVAADPAPDPGGQIGLRVINAGAALGAVDAFTRTGVDAPPGGPLLTNLAFGGVGAYSTTDTARLSIAVTPTGTATRLTQAGGPFGEAGTPAANPIAGLLVPGSALTAIFLPPSVVGSAAPQGGRPAAITGQAVTRSNDTVTVRSGTRAVLTNRSGGAPDSVIASGTTGVVSGVVRSDVVFVSGATETEYNDWQAVLGTVDTLFSCVPTDPGDTATRCNFSPNVVATTHFRYRYRLIGTPASPATGTPVYRIYPRGSTTDYTSPAILYLADRRPAMTVP
ncbi:MAG: DUF4397 domain-containing protein, partial [Gemmatimonadales bacterium]